MLELLQEAEDLEVYCAISQEHEALALQYIVSERIWIYNPNSAKEAFLNGLWNWFNEMDGLFVLTLEQHWKAYLDTCRRYPVLLRIHGLNYIKNAKPHYLKMFATLGVKGLLGELKWQNHIFKGRVLSALEALTPTLPISDEAKKDLLPGAKWIDPVPMTYNRYPPQLKASNPFKVVIPGAVSQEKRNYQEVFKTIRSLSENEFEWVFLGKASEGAMLHKMKGLIAQGFRLKFYEAEVDWDTFDREMLAAHLIWAPVNPGHPFKDAIEEPGKTKITGSVSDALYYGKPILIPAFYPKPHYLDTGFVSYKSEEAQLRIQEIKQNYVSLIPVSAGYALQDVSAQTVNLLKQWLNSSKRS
jgi:hypothetical protein